MIHHPFNTVNDFQEGRPSYFDHIFEEHVRVARATQQNLQEPFWALVDSCLKAICSGRKILFFGNGGSAADAQHLATELTVRFVKNRRAIPALSLVTDTSALTAIGNDLGPWSCRRCGHWYLDLR
jgi:D-sedoheptulose 7-phosphate isomerase